MLGVFPCPLAVVLELIAKPYTDGDAWAKSIKLLVCRLKILVELFSPII